MQLALLSNCVKCFHTILALGLISIYLSSFTSIPTATKEGTSRLYATTHRTLLMSGAMECGMLFGMHGSTSNLQVTRIIVKSITIGMMYKFCNFQRSTKSHLHNTPMFSSATALNGNHPVSIAIYRTGSSRSLQHLVGVSMPSLPCVMLAAQSFGEDRRFT